MGVPPTFQGRFKGFQPPFHVFHVRSTGVLPSVDERAFRRLFTSVPPAFRWMRPIFGWLLASFHERRTSVPQVRPTFGIATFHERSRGVATGRATFCRHNQPQGKLGTPQRKR